MLFYLALGFCVVGCALLVTPFGQRLLLFQLPAWLIRDGGFPREPDRVFTTKNATGFFFAPRSGQPTLFFAHGNSSQTRRNFKQLKPALDLGFGLYFVTYPGFDQNLRRRVVWHGFQLFDEAKGRSSMMDQWNAYKSLGIRPQKTLFMAESLGTTMLPWLATQLKPEDCPKTLIIVAGFDEISHVVARNTFGLVGKWALYDQFSNAEVWRNIHFPTYVAHGGEDWIVGQKVARQLYMKLSGPRFFANYPTQGHLNMPLGEIAIAAADHEFTNRD